MQDHWTTEEIIAHFTLQAEERTLIGINEPHNQLGKAILLKFFQYEARFPDGLSDLDFAQIKRQRYPKKG